MSSKDFKIKNNLDVQGVVRVIWGDATVTRSFPSTNVNSASSSVTETTV